MQIILIILVSIQIILFCVLKSDYPILYCHTNHGSTFPIKDNLNESSGSFCIPNNDINNCYLATNHDIKILIATIGMLISMLSILMLGIVLRWF